MFAELADVSRAIDDFRPAARERDKADAALDREFTGMFDGWLMLEAVCEASGCSPGQYQDVFERFMDSLTQKVKRDVMEKNLEWVYMLRSFSGTPAGAVKPITRSEALFLYEPDIARPATDEEIARAKDPTHVRPVTDRINLRELSVAFGASDLARKFKVRNACMAGRESVMRKAV